MQYPGGLQEHDSENGQRPWKGGLSSGVLFSVICVHLLHLRKEGTLLFTETGIFTDL
jgi:hypothetical protein